MRTNKERHKTIVDASRFLLHRIFAEPFLESAIEKLCFQAGQKGPDARRASNRSFDFRSGQAPHQFPKSNVRGG